jgi:hypothetical protein
MADTIPLPKLPTHTLDREEVDFGIALNRRQTVLYYTEAQVLAIQREAMRAALEAAAKVLTEHQIPVGNSRAGEMAREWTYDALKECRDNIRALKIEGETT